MIDSVWFGQTADLVFLFATPFEHDEFNRNEVALGYADLAAEHSAATVMVPMADTETTTAFLITTMRDRGLLSD